MMGWMDELRQTSLDDQASEVATRHPQEPFAPVRARYAAIRVDMTAVAMRLEAADAARKARADASTAQAVFEEFATESWGATTGEELPGLELTLARGAAATRSATAPTPPPAEPPPGTNVPGL